MIKDGQVVVREESWLQSALLLPPGGEASSRPSACRGFSARKILLSGRARARSHHGIIPEQIITEKLMLEPKRAENGAIEPDLQRDIVKVAVVERHRRSGRIAVALLRGLGLRRGAIASSVAHDSHNIIVAGVDEAAMATAVNTLARCGGGFVAAESAGEVSALLPLPVAGLISPEPAAGVAAALKFTAAPWGLATAAFSDPFLPGPAVIT